MDGPVKTRAARRAAALCLGLLLALALGAPRALAADGGAVSGGETLRLVPVGRTFGVKLFSDGVLVVGLGDGTTPARASGLKEGDIMLAFNGVDIESTEHLQQLVAENGAARAAMSIRRGVRTMTLPITPEEGEDGVCRLGAWTRDSMAGIGTMTFYDPVSGVFGALGHGVTDVDTGQLMPLERGSIMNARVKAVKRGAAGAPGELRGDFDLTHDCGELFANTERGIFGRLGDGAAAFAHEAVPVAPRGAVHTGEATILANCEGDAVRAYAVEIERVYAPASPTRNLLLHVTDPELLALTGGIVQGMSGCPILQDGQLVGAVTHVLLGDAARGYGILIENMLADARGGAA